MNMSQLMTKVSLGVVLAGALAVSLPTASYAFGEQQQQQQQHYFDNDGEPGSTLSYYKGYFSNESEPATRPTQRQQEPARTNSRAPRRTATDPAQPADRPSCMFGADGGCR